ncbi:MAG: hypothetical protein ACKVOE_02495 [Rickettsiales bacterium]
MTRPGWIVADHEVNNTATVMVSTGIQQSKKDDARVFVLPEGKADELAFVARSFGAALAGVGQSPEMNHLAKELFADQAKVNAVTREAQVNLARANAQAEIRAAGRTAGVPAGKIAEYIAGLDFIDNAKGIAAHVAKATGEFLAEGSEKTLDVATESLDDQKEMMEKMWRNIEELQEQVRDILRPQMSDVEKEKDDEFKRRMEAAKTDEERENVEKEYLGWRKKLVADWKENGTPAQKAGAIKAEPILKREETQFNAVVEARKEFDSKREIKVASDTPTVQPKGAALPESSQANQGFLFAQSPKTGKPVDAGASNEPQNPDQSANAETNRGNPSKSDVPALKGVTLANFEAPGQVQFTTKAKPAETGAVMGAGSLG